MKTEATKTFNTTTSTFYPRGGLGEPQTVAIIHGTGPFNRGRCVEGEEQPSEIKAIMPTCHL